MCSIMMLDLAAFRANHRIPEFYKQLQDGQTLPRPQSRQNHVFKYPDPDRHLSNPCQCHFIYCWPIDYRKIEMICQKTFPTFPALL